jgi:hypothetical protein
LAKERKHWVCGSCPWCGMIRQPLA